MTEITITRGFLVIFLILSVAIIQILKTLDSEADGIWQWRIMAGFWLLALIVDGATR